MSTSVNCYPRRIIGDTIFNIKESDMLDMVHNTSREDSVIYPKKKTFWNITDTSVCHTLRTS